MGHAVESARNSSAVDVTVVGDYCVDLILTGNVRPRFGQVEQIVEDGSLEIGGSAAIFAAQSAKLGAQVKAVGWVGNDVFGRLVAEELLQAGVDVSDLRQHQTLKTGIGVALSEPDDRAILTLMGTIDAMRPEDLDQAILANSRHFHLSVFFLLRKMRPIWPKWFATCRELRVTTSLDTNWDPDSRWDGVEELLGLADLFFPNDQEALAISGEKNIEAAGEALSARGAMVVIKRGRNGATAFHHGERWHLAADVASGVPARVVDATGAGDNFNAGFLRGWQLHWDIPACLALGHRCAVGSLEHAGGMRGQMVDRSIASYLHDEAHSGEQSSGRTGRQTGWLGLR